MTGAVVKLVPRTAAQSEGVIKTLENMLEVARRDGLNGVAVAATDLEGCTHSAYEIGHNASTLLGALDRLHHRVLKHVDE